MKKKLCCALLGVVSALLLIGCGSGTSADSTTTADISESVDEELTEVLESQSESFAGGDGTEESPYQIATADQLRRVAELVNANSTKQESPYVSAYYILTDDIDLGGEENPWTPIGDGYVDSVSSFSGVFDGDGHVISGLYINVTEDESLRYYGLFGMVEGSVSGVTLADSSVNVSVESGYYAGGIAGCVSGGTVEDCTVESDVSVSAYYYAGGVAGQGSLSESLIQNCSSAASVTTSADGAGDAGGIAASTSGVVQGCVNTGAVSGCCDAGGIVGATVCGESISGCENQGTVIGETAGGIAGVMNLAQTDGTQGTYSVSDCINTGSVTGTDQAGGIIAFVSATISDAVISGCENAGAVTGEEQAAGIVAYFSGSSETSSLKIESCVNSAAVSLETQDAETEENDEDAEGEAAGILAGIALKNGGTVEIDSCSNIGEITGTALYAGGILGEYTSTLIDDETAETVISLKSCSNEGDVSGDGSYGLAGIAGCVDTKDVGAVTLTISGCTNEGTVYGSSSTPILGGILGYLAPHHVTATIADCSNSGNLTLAEAEISEEEEWFDFCVASGGIVGYIGYKGTSIDTSDDCGIEGTEAVVVFENYSNSGEIMTYDDGREFLTGDLYGAAAVPVQE